MANCTQCGKDVQPGNGLQHTGQPIEPLCNACVALRLCELVRKKRRQTCRVCGAASDGFHVRLESGDCECVECFYRRDLFEYGSCVKKAAEIR